ncbi:MAG: TAT-variant-translocated molybdopterin oxidoreductase [Bdellovibrionales bacterium]|nr:TAT-variant-translocated molybdopterin oxidoreductase [Bdellovibrionales bacterium]
METQQEQSFFWKSIDEKYNTSEYQKQVENEFMSSPLQEEDGKDGLARRQFMKLMGASVALSTAACVRRPVQKIIPYNKRPAEVIPGLPNYYASSFFDGGEGFGVTIKTREGRPLHIEGNPTYPGNSQGLSPRASAQILSLYDPDRIRTPIINSQNPKKRGSKLSVPRDWDSLDKKVADQLKKGGVRVLTRDTASPSLSGLMDKFSSNMDAKVHRWSPVNHGDLVKAQELSYGQAIVPKYRYDKAKMIVSIDADFLGTWINPTESAKLFMAGRNPNGDMSRLVSFQSVASLTSLNADDNYPIKPSQRLPLVLALIHELKGKSSLGGNIGSLTEAHSKAYLALNMSHEEFAAIADKLWENRGRSLVVAGGLQTQGPDSLGLQVAVNLLNSMLDNDGKTVSYQSALQGRDESDGELQSLLADIKDGKVKTLIINDLNPIFNLPQSKELKEALNQVEMVVTTSNWMDETASLADIVAPTGHAMENWGDFEFEKGVFAIQQPTIRPLYETRSFADSLMAWSKAADRAISSSETYFDVIKSKWSGQLGGEKAWINFLQKGFHGEASTGEASSRGFNTSALKYVKVNSSGAGLELSLYTKSTIFDGSMANVSWLQELPCPVSKIVWDNYLVISPVLAHDKHLKDGDMVKVTAGETSLELPIYITPGQHPSSVAVAIGYGRKEGGELQKNVGFDVTPLIQWQGDRLLYSGLAVEIEKTGKNYPLAKTQGHHNMEGRQLAVETSHKNFKETGDIGLHRHKIFSIWSGHKYDGHKWAMGIDMNACTGCSACTVSCQSENNIPVVGKKYVMQGREMHWIRIDRYYKGDESKNPDAIFQPVLCQQCENAPCETVCPVLATVHSDEGLNDMAYNRCVGTRYCANNCPYKVRRFNWFYYDGHHKREPMHMALNPDVTVRTRGVMEKCSFCVQRIKEAKNIAKDQGRALKDGDIKTACQSACPTDAIVFGDLNDEKSRVNEWFKNQRQYTLMEEVNAAPRVRYLARIRNTDRDMGGGHHGGGSHGAEESHDSQVEGEHKEGH